MSRPGDATAPAPADGGLPPASMPVIEEAGRQLRAPWAASIAGILFSVLFTAALVLVRSQPDAARVRTRPS